MIRIWPYAAWLALAGLLSLVAWGVIAIAWTAAIEPMDTLAKEPQNTGLLSGKVCDVHHDPARPRHIVPCEQLEYWRDQAPPSHGG